ncbi:MAG: right-handed parallel beta-helix repeat-containing protein [Thermoguttaceae bacterium]
MIKSIFQHYFFPLLPFLLIATANFCSVLAVEFHVAPTGNDQADGKTANSPFATLQRAQKAVRDFQLSIQSAKQNGEFDYSASVILHDGTYFLAEPLHFTSADSGTKEFPVSWKAAPNAKPIISGGFRVTNWTKVDDKLFSAPVPETWKELESPNSFFVNGNRAICARTPNEGNYFYTSQIRLEKGHDTPLLGIKYAPKDIPNWISDPDVRLVLYHNWTNSNNRVGSIDANRKLLHFARPSGIFTPSPETRYYLVNVLEALDEPGEWVYHRKDNKIYYWPRSGEDMLNAETIVSRVGPTLFEINGDYVSGKPVEHLSFNGLIFSHTQADLSPNYSHSVQGANTQRGVFHAVGLRHSQIINNTFTHLGEHGISFWDGCQQNQIRQNHIFDLGGGGIYLSKSHPESTNDEYMTSHNLIENNLIHDGGKLFASGVGIFMAGSANHNKVLHNEIFNINWCGIHAGWSWSGTNKSYTHHNEFAYNRIYQLGNGVMCDLAGVYFLGISDGTLFHHNRIYNVSRFTRGNEGYGGWGIYLDAGSSNIRVENNIVHDTQDGGLHLHCYAEPFGDVIENNIFAFAINGELMRNANMESKLGNHATLKRNIIYAASPNIYHGYNWNKGSNFQTESNCLWSISEEKPIFGGRSWDEWRADGNDANSRWADPLFKDASKRNFELLSESPAIQIGFVPIDESKIGLIGEREWTELPKQFPLRNVETGTPSQKDARFFDDYEEYLAGELPDGTQVYDGNETSTIRVAEGGANGSQQCLKFIDEANLPLSYNPHLVYQRDYPSGKLRCAFDLKLTKGAICQYEWRDYDGQKYTTGPVVIFREDGVFVAGKKLIDIPLDQWVHFEITNNPRIESESTWDFSATISGEKTQTFTDLKYGEKFRKLNWIGFISTADAATTYYLDNFIVEPSK